MKAFAYSSFTSVHILSMSAQKYQKNQIINSIFNRKNLAMLVKYVNYLVRRQTAV